jgi:hypothetical protein
MVFPAPVRLPSLKKGYTAQNRAAEDFMITPMKFLNP